MENILKVYTFYFITSNKNTRFIDKYFTEIKCSSILLKESLGVYNMKKVLHILNSLLPSGAETMLNAAAPYWNSNIEIHILATKENLGEYGFELEKSGYIIHHISRQSYLQQHKAVTEFIKKNKFDVVHIHRQEQALSYALDALFGGVKCIVRTVHNVFQFKGLILVRELITRQIACLIGVKHIAISKSVYENEKSHFFVNCRIINNWFNEKKFLFTDLSTKNNARAQLNIGEDKYCIISVGNCTSVKNHMTILKALKNIKDYQDISNVLYLHVGKGIQENEELEFINNNNLRENVMYVGFQDPLVYLQAADLFIMPSVYEGVGISALEAMATGLPCLLTSVYGLKDFEQYEFENMEYSVLDDKSIEVSLSRAILNKKSGNSKAQSEMVLRYYGIHQGVNEYQEVYFR